MTNSFAWPRISIITPSYNQGQYLEETIDSVLSQNYPNLEYIVIDGGSNDQSVDILRRYDKHLHYWVSEKDRGQTHAINKGLEKATGSILAYINSDDYYLPDTFRCVAETFVQREKTDLLHGRCRYVNVTGEKIGDQFGNIHSLVDILDVWNVWWKKRQFVQPEVFWSKRISERVGPFRENLNFVMDYEYWLRIVAAGGHVESIDREFTCFRLTPEQKSNQSDAVATEILQVLRPWLWSRQTHIPWTTRLRLQGEWLYQSRFQTEVEKSLFQNEGRKARWTKLMLLMMANPQLITASHFRQRISNVLTRSSAT